MMTLAGLRRVLNHRCTIQRQASGTANAHNQNGGAWGTQASSVPCRFMADRSEEQEQPVAANAKTWRVAFAAGVDVTRKDRLVYDGGTYEILDVVDDVAGADAWQRVIVRRVI